MTALAHREFGTYGANAFDVVDHMSRTLASPWHEAGHAVIARVLQMPAGGVSIAYDAVNNRYGVSRSADPGYCLKVWKSEGQLGTAKEARDAVIITSMAGAEAERLFAAGCDDALPNSSCGVTRVVFDRQAASLEAAIRSAIANVQAAGRVVARVEFEPRQLAPSA